MLIGRRIERFRKIQRIFGLVQPRLSQEEIFRSGGSKDQKQWKYFKNNY
jgi:hypothetical protein